MKEWGRDSRGCEKGVKEEKGEMEEGVVCKLEEIETDTYIHT